MGNSIALQKSDLGGLEKPWVNGGLFAPNLDNLDDTIHPQQFRNLFWAYNSQIPAWVDIEEVGLDQFFTQENIAKYCYNSLIDTMRSAHVDVNSYHFIEPSAGQGAFYSILPNNRRIGIDVEQFNPDYIKADFLSWMPKQNDKKYVCIGNPPFGYRAWLALAFMNHAAQFSDFVGFIVPMAFQSRGKSNVQDRVKNLYLVHSSTLPSNCFIDRQGQTLKVNALWQIWSRFKPKSKISEKTCNEYLDLFTVDLRKERKCGHARLHQADYFIQRTFYADPPKLVKSFDQVKYVCGYGIVLKKNKEKIIEILSNTDWRIYSNLASHNCRHISMCHIRAALTENGITDAD